MSSRAKLALVLAAACAVLPASAEASSLRLHRLGSANQPAVTSFEGGDVAFARDGTLSVAGPDDRLRTYPVPARCASTAISRTAVALICYFPATGDSPYLLDRASGRITPVPLPFPTPRAQISALGAKWAELDYTVSSEDGIHSDDRRALLNLTTGQTVDLSRADPYGSHRYLDLDAEKPARALCRPITRSGYSATSQIVLQRRPITRSGRWFLEQDSTGLAELQHCGRRAKRRFDPERAVLTGNGYVAVLGDGIVGYVTKDSRRPIVLERLASGRRWSARRPPGTGFELAAAGRRLIISTQTPGGPYDIYSATTTR